ncbi:excinuclease ABC subunit UvrC [Tepidiforma thermophila]|uniref:UvrABC system protein C n=1 Tax=Tepidiforma thermophila (strain KCTC 52669 / CGMCC 1.13589 / G233) TaxID=2761530 RepID=A0A2A9HGW8_TEPT2|nr:excinuclease ABC subunit UvrC [Tepidiforma thermophila]PFG75277.1 excinuclease ABC subunit C [Tepidiforma thermophila]
MASSTISEKLRKQLAALPARPGVYIMRNAAGEVIYVGKAARLRDRVRSYFGSPRGLEPKTRALREQIDDFEYIVVSSPAEALLLEAALIKRHQPFFNIRLKDDKRYPYLKIDLQNPWPRVSITRRIENDGARYFGPYASAGSVRATLDLTKKLFPWRSCTKEITGRDPRPCLDYYIKRCIAPCTAYCTKEEYDEVIQQVILFLEGKADDVLRRLRKQMDDAAERLEFERAAQLRDQIRAIERTVERQHVATTRNEDADIFGLARDGDDACVQVFFIRGTQMIGRDSFMLAGVRDEPDATVLANFLLQYYEGAQYIPKLVAVPAEPEDRESIEELLTEKRGSRVEIRIPARGEKRRLVDLAAENAREALAVARVRWLADASKTEQALEQLREELSLPATPHRIECYDNSNIQGTSPVSSMVVFVDGRPAPNQYRRFRVKTVQGANDFATMQEVLRRRFGRHARTPESLQAAESPGAEQSPADAWDLPDLVIIDGGKGQLSAALEVMHELGVHHIPVVALAKRHEEIFVPDDDEPIILPRGSEALFLVQRIRDEAHRFAITFHRQVRGKSTIQSALDTIPGIGPKRKKALLKKFGSVKAIREADVDEIAATVGFTRALAERVKAQL